MAWEQQSPINLRGTVSADAPKDYLRLSWSAAIEGFRRNGTHGVEVLFGVMMATKSSQTTSGYKRPFAAEDFRGYGFSFPNQVFGGVL